MVELEGPGGRLERARERADPDPFGDRGGTPDRGRVVVEEVLPAHGLMPPLTASDHDRFAYVIEGRLGAFIGHNVTAGPGSIVSIPRGAAAALWNALPRDCPETRLVVAPTRDGDLPLPLAVEPAACGPDTRIAVLHVWELEADAPEPILTT